MFHYQLSLNCFKKIMDLGFLQGLAWRNAADYNGILFVKESKWPSFASAVLLLQDIMSERHEQLRVSGKCLAQG